MDNDLSKLVEKIDQIDQRVSEVEVITRKLRNAQIRSRIFKALYLIALIGIGLVMFYYLRPVYEQLGQIYNYSSGSGVDIDIENIDPNQIQNILNQFGY